MQSYIDLRNVGRTSPQLMEEALAGMSLTNQLSVDYLNPDGQSYS